MKGWRHNTVNRPKRPPRPPRTKRHQSQTKQFAHDYLSLACINQRRARSPIAAYGSTEQEEPIIPKPATCPPQNAFYYSANPTIHPEFSSASLPIRAHRPKQNIYNTTPTTQVQPIYPTMHTAQQHPHRNISNLPHTSPTTIANTDQVFILRQQEQAQQPRLRPNSLIYDTAHDQRRMNTIPETDAELNAQIRQFQRQTRERQLLIEQTRDNRNTTTSFTTLPTHHQHQPGFHTLPPPLDEAELPQLPINQLANVDRIPTEDDDQDQVHRVI